MRRSKYAAASDSAGPCPDVALTRMPVALVAAISAFASRRRFHHQVPAMQCRLCHHRVAEEGDICDPCRDVNAIQSLVHSRRLGLWASFAAASLLHGVATALTALSRGPPDDERPGGHDRVRSRSRSRSRGDSRASPPRGDGAPPTEPSHELVQAAAAVVMAAKGTGSNRRRGNSAGTGKGNGHGKGKGKNKDKGSRR